MQSRRGHPGAQRSPALPSPVKKGIFLAFHTVKDGRSPGTRKRVEPLLDAGFRLHCQCVYERAASAAKGIAVFSFFSRKRKRSRQNGELDKSDKALLGFALPSALACLSYLGREILKIAPDRSVFTRDLVDAFDAEPLDALMRCADKLGFEPMLCREGVLPDSYSGPVLLRKKDGEWCCLLWSESLDAPSVTVWEATIRLRALPLWTSRLRFRGSWWRSALWPGRTAPRTAA